MSRANKLDNLKHYCYIITNLLNNKVYVGVTYKSIKDRFKEHVKGSRAKYKQVIHKSIYKYGADNFKIELLSEHSNAKSAFDAEIVYIKQYKSEDGKYGYNKSSGGDCGPLRIKYTTKIIIDIITDFCNGINLKEIAKNYNISYYSTFDITRLRISPTHNIPKKLLNKLTKVKSSSNKRKRVDLKLMVDIITDFIDDMIMDDISKKYKLCINTIWNIVNRYTWKNVDIGQELEFKLKEKLSSNRYWSSSSMKKQPGNK